MNLYILSAKEKEVMNALWDSKSSMTGTEICKNNGLNINTVQAALKKLLKKEYIEVKDIVYSNTVLTRSYAPKITPDEYASIQLEEYYRSSGKKKSLANIVSYLLDEEENQADQIKELKKLLKAREKLLKDN
ncbi:hypothetical protein FACS189418_1930 [Clostridia bacterium]|nr:hypothetical protein FACS189418_1930 [Clostridia bacterium]